MGDAWECSSSSPERSGWFGAPPGGRLMKHGKVAGHDRRARATCEELKRRCSSHWVDYEEIGKLVMAWMKAQIPSLVDPT